MKKINKFVYVILVIAIITILVLIYFLITKNILIDKQAKEIELQAMETNGSNSYTTTEDHLNESIKIWEKTYTYSQIKNGYQRTDFKTSDYVSLANSSVSTGCIYSIDANEYIDPSRFLSVAIYVWSSDSPDSAEKNSYLLRSVRGDNKYTYEYPVFYASRYNYGSGYRTRQIIWPMGWCRLYTNVLG